ncbi:MAG: TIGR01777 family oxidoreductase [Fimbriimonadaceae bacterium]
MKLVLSGGNGFIGRQISAVWRRSGHEVVVLARSPGLGQAAWDGRTIGAWTAELEGADLLLNLAGRSVNCRYNDHNKEVIRRSRVESTRVLAEAVGSCARPPRAWFNSSTATIYRHAQDRPMDDETGEIGRGFSVEVAKAWEAEFFKGECPSRRLALRTAMVMGPGDDGAFAAYSSLAKRGLGGRMGDGEQMVSWIHIEDFARAVEFLLATDASGTINVSAPGPLSNEEFMSEISRALGKKVALPTPKWLLEVGAFFLRTETELPLKSRWVLPSRLQSLGFEFRFPEWKSAVADLLQQ